MLKLNVLTKVSLLVLVALIALVAYIGIMAPTTGSSALEADGDAQDSEGNNHGTLVGGTAFAPGIDDEAFSFDGIDDHVLVPDSPSLNPTTAITIAGWVSSPASRGRTGISSVKMGKVRIASSF